MEIIKNTYAEHIAEFRIIGALDTLQAPEFIETIRASITDTTKALILDCTEMPYLTSTGLRAIMILGQATKAINATMTLCGLSGLALEIFTTSGFSTIFPLAKDTEEARARADSALGA